MPSSTFSSSIRSLARLAALIVLLFVGSAVVLSVLPLTDTENHHYLMAAVDDAARLERTADVPRRIVLLGGSSLGWSVSAKEITGQTGVQTVNLGVDAGIGYRLIYDLYADDLDPRRDVLVLSPEVALVQATPFLTNEFCNVLMLRRELSVRSLICAPLNVEFFLKMHLQAMLGGYDNLYRRDGFNEFGDYVSHYYEAPRTYASPIYRVFVEDYERYVAAYNDFVADLRAKGFTVVYIPTIEAMQACDPSEDRYAFNKLVAKGALSAFDSDFPFCMNDRYFFNTDYHMLFEGVQIKTQLFIDELAALDLLHPAQPLSGSSSAGR